MMLKSLQHQEIFLSGLRGKDVSAGNKNQGFTHVLESPFESMEGVAEYIGHPAHVEYAKTLLPHVEKYMVIDYKPTTFNFGLQG
ncbi:hypothetical protein ACB094_11G174300 [Castanea mollissima]